MLIVQSFHNRTQNENEKQRINCKKISILLKCCSNQPKHTRLCYFLIYILSLRFAYKKKKLKCCTKMIFFCLTQHKVRINDKTCFLLAFFSVFLALLIPSTRYVYLFESNIIKNSRVIK